MDYRRNREGIRLMETLYCACCGRDMGLVDGGYADLVAYCFECGFAILDGMMNKIDENEAE